MTIVKSKTGRNWKCGTEESYTWIFTASK